MSNNYTDEGIRNLAAAMLRQAMKDYVSAEGKKKDVIQQKILRDLKSPWCDLFTNGQAEIVVEKLCKHPDLIKQNLKVVKE